MALSAADAIREQVQERYGIDVDALGTGADGAAELNEATREQAAAAGENTQAAQLLAEAERADTAQRQSVEAENSQPEQLRDEAAAAYDSAARREALGKSLDHIADREALHARLNADRDQATPPAAAVGAPRNAATQARQTRTAPRPVRQPKNDLSR